jgi:hypothetical protein
MDEGVQILELARNAQRLFERQEPRQKRRLLNFVLSNCSWEDGEVVATFRQPFDLLAETTAKQKWQRLAFDDVEFYWLRTSDKPFLGCAFYFHAGERAEFQIGLAVLGDVNGQPLQTQIFDEVGVGRVLLSNLGSLETSDLYAHAEMLEWAKRALHYAFNMLKNSLHGATRTCFGA